MSRRLAFMIAAFGILLLPKFALAATGDLLKLSGDSAVYYVAADAKRYVFLDAGTYASWYPDFSGIKTVTAAQMAAIPFGGAVTRRPGTRMIKLQTDPRTYAVDRGGTLRWVTTEAIASALYGPAWNTQIDDTSDAFFANYRLGTPITSSDGFSPQAAKAATPDISTDLGFVTAPPVGVANGGFEAAVSGQPLTGILAGKNVKMADFIFTATSSAATMSSLNVQTYLDVNEGIADYGVGFDEDNGTGYYAGQLVSSVSLYDDAGVRLAGPLTVPPTGMVSFNGFTFTVAAGQTRMLTLRGDLVRGFDIGPNEDHLAFDLPDYGFPNGGLTPTAIVTVKKSGSATFTWTGSGGPVIAGRTVQVGQLEIETHDDVFQLKKISLSVNGRVESINRLRMDVTTAAGSVSTWVPYASTAVWSGLDVPLSAGKTTIFFYAELKTAPTAQEGEHLALAFSSAAPFEMDSSSTGDVFRETWLGTSDFPVTGYPSDLTVRYTALSAATDASTPIGDIGRGRQTQVLAFTLHAQPESGARISKLSFKLEPSDVGTTGLDNDSLELWSDETIIAKLEVPGVETPIGSFRYSIVHHDVKDTTPQGVETSYGDYGVVEFVFSAGSELVIPAGATVTYRLDLDTYQMPLGLRTLKVGLMGASDFLWIDSPDGGYAAPLDGTAVQGLPMQSSTLNVP